MAVSGMETAERMPPATVGPIRANLVDRLVGGHLVAGRGDALCCVDPASTTLTYAQLHRAAGALAGVLRAAGTPPGTRCLVVSDDTIEAVAVVLALWWCGCVPVPVAPLFAADRIAFLATDCAAGLAYVDLPAARHRPLVAALRTPVLLDPGRVRQVVRTARRDTAAANLAPPPVPQHPDDEVLVQYPAGGAGTPRRRRHRARDLSAVLAGGNAVFGLVSADTVLCTAKLSFGHGLANTLLLPLAVGATSVLLPGPPDAVGAAEALRRYTPTVLFAAPRLYAGLLDLLARADGAAEFTRCLRLAVSVGEPLPGSLARRITGTLGVRLVATGRAAGAR